MVRKPIRDYGFKNPKLETKNKEIIIELIEQDLERLHHKEGITLNIHDMVITIRVKRTIKFE